MQKWEYCSIEIYNKDTWYYRKGSVTYFKPTGEHETQNIHPPKKDELLATTFYTVVAQLGELGWEIIKPPDFIGGGVIFVICKRPMWDETGST